MCCTNNRTFVPLTKASLTTQVSRKLFNSNKYCGYLQLFDMPPDKTRWNVSGKNVSTSSVAAREFAAKGLTDLWSAFLSATTTRGRLRQAV
jgi:hypothetical protein